MLIRANGNGNGNSRRYITWGMGVGIILLLIFLGLLCLGNVGMNIGLLVEHDKHHDHKHGDSDCNDNDPCTEDRHQSGYCEWKPIAPGHECESSCCGPAPVVCDWECIEQCEYECECKRDGDGEHSDGCECNCEEQCDCHESKDRCAIVPNVWPRCTTCECQTCAGTCEDFNQGVDCPELTINGTLAEPGQNPKRDCDNKVCIYSIGFDTNQSPNFNDIDIPCHKDHKLFIDTCACLLNTSEAVVKEHCLEVVPICGETTLPGESETNLGISRLEACAYHFSCSKAEFVPPLQV